MYQRPNGAVNHFRHNHPLQCDFRTVVDATRERIACTLDGILLRADSNLEAAEGARPV